MPRAPFAIVVLLAAALALALVVVFANGGGEMNRQTPTMQIGGSPGNAGPSASCPVQASAAEAGAPPPGAVAPHAGAERAVCDWALAEAKGDFNRATDMFALPALVETPVAGGQVSVQRLSRRADVRDFNAGLPCAATPLRAVDVTSYTIVSFRLFARPGGAPCAGIGNVAFIVRDGLILAWLRVPDDLRHLRLPGLPPDSGGPESPQTPSAPSPGAPNAPAPVV